MSGSAPEGAPFRSLTGRAAFAAVYRKGERARSGGVVVLAAAGEAGPPTVGVVAGKRVGGAVARNRAKRRLRAAMAGVELKADTSYVVIADSEVVDVEYERLVKWLQRAVEKLPQRKEQA